jgi:hypothetical protein
MYTFHDTVMASVAFLANQVTKPGAHLSLTNCDDFEDISQVDRLATKIHQESQEHKLHEEATKQEKAAMKKKKKEASDYLAPPPASSLETRPFSSFMEPLGDHQKNNEPTMASNRNTKAHNNLQSDVINIDEDEDGKENICPLSVKKHHTTVSGTDFICMFTSAISKVDPTTGSIATLMQQCTQFLELAEQHCHDAEERAHCSKERLQHLQLLQMHSGKID